MNYKKVYDQLIKRSKNRVIEGYTEKHHIVPRCIGGLDVSENITTLTAREHFICHWLLARIYDEPKLKYAFHAMCSFKNKFRYTPSSRAIQEAKESLVMTQEHKDKISKTLKGRIFSEEHCKNISSSRKGKKQTEESNRKRSEAAKGKVPWNKGKTGTFKGKKHSQETKDKISASLKKRYEEFKK